MRPGRGVCISITQCMATVGKGWLQDIQWMLFAWKQKRCSSSTAAIGMAVQSAWCGFKIWRRLATCVKWRRESAKWISRALLGGDCGLRDGQAQGVRFYYLLSGQVPPQAWLQADRDGHRQPVLRAVVWLSGKGGVPRHGGKVANLQKGMVCVGQMECSRAGTFQAGIRGHSQNHTVQQVLFHGILGRRGESVLDGELKAPKQNAPGAVQGRAGGGGHRFRYEQRNETEWRGDVHLAAKKRIFSHRCLCILKPFSLFLFLTPFVKQQTKFDFLNLFWKVVDNRLHQISSRINKVVLCSHYTDNKLCQCLVGAGPYCLVMASTVYARAAILLRWGGGQKKCDYFLLGLCGVGGVWWSHSLVKMCFRSTAQVVGSES